MGKLSIVTVALVALLLGATLVWKKLSNPPAPKLIVLGVDGLDHRVAEGMIARGELPALAQLYRRGAVGTVRNSDLGLPAISPAIWTTYVTGVTHEQHGVHGFVFETPEGAWELFRSLDRKVPAIWEMLSEAEKTIGVVNWWFSFPPEAVRGFVVSDRYFESEVEGLSAITHGRTTHKEAPAVYPVELVGRLGASRAEKLPRVLSANEAAMLDGAMLNLAYAAVRIVPVDVLLVYLNGLDRVSHMTWDAADPERLGGSEVREHMHTVDGYVARLLSWAGERAHLVVLSDHGFEANPNGEPRGVHESKEAADAGVLLLIGPAIQPGTKLGEVSPLDVLPTLLALVDSPLPEGAQGTILRQAFRPGSRDFAALENRRRYSRLPAVEGRARVAGDVVDQVDQATKERLRALGYIE
ncbi:MAG: alkaline phosphatase family protein [Candidatus Binatia bacterium]|nr:alkaline phosphatase family protein [Candidatus Binatia bacterium]